MITTAELKSQTRRDLADLARQHEITGWHGMRKDELIEALRKVQRRARRKPAEAAGGSAEVAKGSAKSGGGEQKVRSRRKPSLKSGSSAKSSARSTGSAVEKKPSVSGAAASQKAASRKSSKRSRRRSRVVETAPKQPTLSTDSLRMLKEKQAMRERLKDLSMQVSVGSRGDGRSEDTGTQAEKDRAILLVRDPFWLHVAWEITRASVQRAQAALAEHWHTARPIVRLVTITDAATNAAEQKVRDIQVHGGVNNWYIDVLGEPARYRVQIGYLSGQSREDEHFHIICRSNIVQTPVPGACDPIDAHWQDIAENYERVFSLSGGHNDGTNGDLREVFEERLLRPMKSPEGQRFSDVRELSVQREKELPFEVDAELIVFGTTTKEATVSLGGQPIRLNPDGTFTMRMELPDRRQVLPVVATTRDGMLQRTTIISVERNTKVMEPYEYEEGDF